MAGHTSAAAARTGNNPFLRFVAALSTLAGWCSAAMIVASVAITCQMIVIRFVLNGSTIWQTEAVIYFDDRGHPCGAALRSTPQGPCER